MKRLALLGLSLWVTAAEAQVELRGRVLDDSGDPIPGVTIQLAGIGYSVRSDSTGRFALSGARGTTMQLYFTAPGFRRDSASVVLGTRRLDRDFTLLGADVPVPESNPSDAVLRGRVVDESGAPLSYANVQVSYGRRYLADDSGRFQVPRPGGSATLLVRRIGFEPTDLRLESIPDTAVQVVMKPIPVQLKGVVVTGASPFRSLDTYGFYGRMKDSERGINRGYFITPEDIERRKPSWISQMAEGFPTVRVCGRISVTCPAGDPRGEMILGQRACLMTVYLDNIRIVPGPRGEPGSVNELALPNHVAAMEIYPRAVAAPPQYPSANGMCGVVLLWTK